MTLLRLLILKFAAEGPGRGLEPAFQYGIRSPYPTGAYFLAASRTFCAAHLHSKKDRMPSLRSGLLYSQIESDWERKGG